MSDLEIIRRLQWYFDGMNLSQADVIRQTGLPSVLAGEVAEAIGALLARPIPPK